MQIANYFQDQPINISINQSEVKAFSSQHRGNFKPTEFCHSWEKVVYVRKGKGSLVTKGYNKNISQGTLLYIPRGVEHYFKDDEPLSLCGICFFNDIFKPLLDSISKGCSGVVLLNMKNPILKAQFVSITQSIIRDDVEELGFKFDRASALLTNFLVELNHCIEIDNNLDSVNKMISYINRYFITDISLDDLTDLSGFSRRKTTDMFKKHTGHTVSEFLQIKRVGYACEQLRDHGIITIAAHDSGFNDLSHFFRVFKKIMNKTPKEYIDTFAQ